MWVEWERRSGGLVTSDLVCRKNQQQPPFTVGIIDEKTVDQDFRELDHNLNMIWCKNYADELFNEIFNQERRFDMRQKMKSTTQRHQTVLSRSIPWQPGVYPSTESSDCLQKATVLTCHFISTPTFSKNQLWAVKSISAQQQSIWHRHHHHHGHPCLLLFILFSGQTNFRCALKSFRERYSSTGCIVFQPFTAHSKGLLAHSSVCLRVGRRLSNFLCSAVARQPTLCNDDDTAHYPRDILIQMRHILAPDTHSCLIYWITAFSWCDQKCISQDCKASVWERVVEAAGV